MKELGTSMPELKLVTPDVDRDAPISVGWLEGESGKDTLRLMGNAEKDIKPTDLEAEKQRIREFLTTKDQIVWTLQYDSKSVGAVWVDLKPTEYLSAPAVHMMIGDPEVRGKGIGASATQAIVRYLKEENKYAHLYSRHLAHNQAARALLKKAGFDNSGEPYSDNDGLEWQNVRMRLNEVSTNKTVGTVCFIISGGKVLLAEIEYPDGKKLWNGIGGVVESGETPTQGLLREISEETELKIKAEDAIEATVLTIADLELHVFVATKWEVNLRQ